MENLKQQIISMFYDRHLRVKDISESINTSSAYITKVIKYDTRYKQEKEFRKSLSKEKRKIAQNKFIKEKREMQRIQHNNDILLQQHIQAVRELSGARHLSNENYRKWNLSAYKYNPSKKQYEFDNKLGRSYDIPKFIKER